MGAIVDSCKSTIKCCDSDDERGYRRTITDNLSSDSVNNNDESSDTEQKPKEKEAPKDINKMKISTNNIFIQHHISPWKFYEDLETLGEGNYGIVKKVRLIKHPDVIRAMKIIPEENIIKGEGESLIDEIEILKNLEHPNIMKVYESYVYDNNYYIISEMCDQGHLLSKIEKLEKMDQIVVKFLMEQIFNAVAYLHSKNILHGDIKLENILLYTASNRGGRRFTYINQDFNENESLTEDINKNYGKKNVSTKSKNYIKDMMNYEIKLIDFGCSKYFVRNNKKKKLSGIIGTSIYCSPEVVDNLYDERCDEWSCGVLMYILLCGEPPFYGDTEEEIFDKVKKCEYSFSNPAFKKVSKNCKDLIRRLLEPKKQYRIKAKEALRHPFFTENFDPNSAMTENTDLNYLKQFINPIGYISKFHEAIIAFLCVNFISVDEENNLRKLFRYMDKEGKNAVGKEDLKLSLEEIDIKISDEELDKIFDTVDENGTGLIEYNEFIRNACDIKALLSESNLKNVFHAICGDKNLMSGEDIKRFIFHDAKINEQALNEYFDSFGMKYENSISFDEFYRMIKKNKKLGQKKVKKKKSKYIFEGPVIDEANNEEEQESFDDKNDNDGDNEEEKEEEINEEIKGTNNKDKINSELETNASNGIKA